MYQFPQAVRSANLAELISRLTQETECRATLRDNLDTYEALKREYQGCQSAYRCALNALRTAVTVGTDEEFKRCQENADEARDHAQIALDMIGNFHDKMVRDIYANANATS